MGAGGKKLIKILCKVNYNQICSDTICTTGGEIGNGLWLKVKK